MNTQTVLLDTSFLIDLLDEAEAGIEGPAFRALDILPKRGLYVSPVTVAETLEGTDDEIEIMKFLAQFEWQTIGGAVAQRCALNQARSSRRMGENDAWQAALAMVSGHALVGHDHCFENRPGLDYIDHRRF